MAFIPDVIVVTDYSPATIALAAEAKDATANLDDAALQLKRYMLQMGCAVGIILTPQVLRICKDRYLGRSEESIAVVGDFPSGELFEIWQPVTGVEAMVEFTLAPWLDELARTGDVRVSNPHLKSAIEEYILPAITGGYVSITRPGTLER